MRTLARARTLTVLGRLDEAHKRSVAQFLVEAFLIQDKFCTVLPCKPVISLEGADLEGVYFGGTAATNTNGAYSASFVPLDHADMSGANLSGADLTDTDLSSTDLEGTNLSDAVLVDASLDGTEGSDADMSGANLSHTSFPDTFLIEADLEGARGPRSERSVLSGVGCLCTFVDASLRIGDYCCTLRGVDTSAEIEVTQVGSS